MRPLKTLVSYPLTKRKKPTAFQAKLASEKAVFRDLVAQVVQYTELSEQRLRLCSLVRVTLGKLMRENKELSV